MTKLICSAFPCKHHLPSSLTYTQLVRETNDETLQKERLERKFPNWTTYLHPGAAVGVGLLGIGAVRLRGEVRREEHPGHESVEDA